jgi:hypothetical protein
VWEECGKELKGRVGFVVNGTLVGSRMLFKAAQFAIVAFPWKGVGGVGGD